MRTHSKLFATLIAIVPLACADDTDGSTGTTAGMSTAATSASSTVTESGSETGTAGDPATTSGAGDSDTTTTATTTATMTATTGDGESTTTAATTGDATTAGVSDSDGDSTTTAGDSTTTGDGTTTGDDDPCAGMKPMQMFDFSYIWISNSPQGTVSKINTVDALEEGRYLTGPSNTRDPSRTSVSLDGRYVAVANRDGGITVLATELEDCVDSNNNGMIETSKGADDVLPWGEDECVLWNVPLPGKGILGPRPVAWNIGELNPQTCEYDLGDVWVSWGVGTTAYFRLLDGADGTTITEVSVKDFSDGFYGPYGGAVDGHNNFWVTGATWGALMVKIDGKTWEPTAYPNPGDEFIYGMALDPDGNVIAVTYETLRMYKFDTVNEVWSQPLGGFNAQYLRGMTVDVDGTAWIALNGQCGLAEVDTVNMEIIDDNVALPGCDTPVGVSIDAEGYVWTVDQGANLAFKMNPDDYSTEQVTGLISPYTYSDMTGAGLVNQLPQ